MMRKLATILLCLFILVGIIGTLACGAPSPSTSSTDTPTEEYPTPTDDEYFTFTLLEDGTYSIKVKDVNNVPNEVVIPQTHDGKNVTVIDTFAFIFIEESKNDSSDEDFTLHTCKTVTKVTLPNTIKAIGEGAFAHCENLQEINIPSSVTVISSSVFVGCKSLTEIIIPGSITKICDLTFIGCTSLATIFITNKTTYIGQAAFNECDNLKDVYYNGTSEDWDKTTIESANNCLLEATIHFGYDAHYHIYNKEVKEPTCTEQGYTTYSCECGDSYIDDYVEAKHNFIGGICSNCKTVQQPTSGVIYEISEDGTYAIVAGYEGEEKDVVLADTYKNLPVRQINCLNNKCETVIIPASIQFVGDINVFHTWIATCKQLEIIAYSPYLFAFTNISSANTKFNIENGLKYIGNPTNPYLVLVGTVSDDITTATINENCEAIGASAFSGCRSLTEIVIPDSVTMIGSNAFWSCNSLTRVTIGNSVTHIGSAAFYSCWSLTSLTIPASVISIGQRAFSLCYNLSELEILNSSIEIGENSFEECISLQYTIEDDLKYLGNSNNPYLYLVGTTSTYITSININSNCKSILYHVFEKCHNLNYTIENNLKYAGSENNPYLYLVGATSSNITSAKINANCKYIGYSAFEFCHNLTEVTIPSNVISIGSSAFYCCCNLTSITIENGVTSIGGNAFILCDSLTEIIIPDSVTTIAYNAFASCYNLKTVYYNGTKEDWNKISIDLHNTNLTDATRYYYSESEPTTDGNYWHYVNGVPTVWIKEN